MRAGAQRSRVINAFGACTTGLVFVIVMATKFLEGAWLAVLAAIVLFVMMRGIRKHYDSVSEELAVEDPRADSVRPSRVHGIVLVSKLHKPTLRALGYAEAFRPDLLEAVTVAVEKEDTEELKAQWEQYDLRVPLKVLDSPYREITKPVVAYVRSVRRNSPRDAVAVFIPSTWWATGGSTSCTTSRRSG